MSKIRYTGKSLTGEQQDFLTAFSQAVADAGGTAVDVISGYRSPAYNRSIGGASNSNHTRGDAIDARVLMANGQWVPAGTLSTLSSYGLRSGDQPGFFNGQRDPNHVDFGAPGSNGSSSSNGSNGLPGGLGGIISTAASAYHVPADVLAGIWKIETGGHYPNPYVNSSGYGGLFGTHNWNAPEQAQANTAAEILSRLIREKGSLPAALLSYSGGGYSSVSGVNLGSLPTSSPLTQTGAAGATTPSTTPAKQPDNTALLAALLSSQPTPQPMDLPDWSHVPATAPSLLPLLFAGGLK